MNRTLEEAARDFARDGVVVVPGLFRRDEVEALKRESVRVLEDVRREIADAGNDPDAAFRVGVYVGMAARSDVFRETIGDARLIRLIRAFIGPNVEFLSDKVVFKNQRTDFGSPWHQDWPYWGGSHKLSVWVALDDATQANGCLRVLPGSHQEAVVHDGDAGDGLGFGHRLRPEAVDESRALTVELEAGGAIFFHDLTLHASHPNTTGADRWVWIPTYRDAQAQDPDYPWAVAATVLCGTKLREP